jgi:ribosome-associated translation inhibitor RaiA
MQALKRKLRKLKRKLKGENPNDAKGKSKSKVDPAIFRMAEERDY